VASEQDGIAAQIRNIETRYGRPLSEWFGLIATSGLTKHSEVVAMLKADYGLAHGAAHRVSLLSRQPAAPATAPASPSEVANALYTGKKASLRPLHDQLMAVIDALGADVTPVPESGSHWIGNSAPRSAAGRGPKIRRCDASIGMSLMLASRRRIRPCSSNSHSSLP